MDRDAFDVSLGDIPDFRDPSGMRWAKYDYDAALDLASEYEVEVIAKGIRDHSEQRARAYLSKNGDAVWRRIERALREAKALAVASPGPALVVAMTAAELTVRFLLLRPLVAGLVMDATLADRIATEATCVFH